MDISKDMLDASAIQEVTAVANNLFAKRAVVYKRINCLSMVVW